MGSDLGRKQTNSYCFNLSIKLNVFLIAVILGLCLHTKHGSIKGLGGSTLKGGEKCAISFGSYHGHIYNNKESGTVGPPKCLVESKWMKVQQHTVRMPGSTSVIDDWLWIDYHDRINVLVEAEAKLGQQERMFLVFEQSKYALEGRMSKAIIGGIIEPNEQAEHAARREVEEEMGLQCQTFHFLGRFRTDVNRGMGWVNSFLATECSKNKPGEGNYEGNDKASSATKEEEVGAADTERQDLKAITLTELRRAARGGEFLEVQWSATVALALLHPEIVE